MTRLLVALHLRFLEIMSPEEDRERGQGTLEYVGMIAVAAILVLAVLAATKTVDLGSFFTTKIKQVLDYK